MSKPCSRCAHVEILTGECRKLVWQPSEHARASWGKCGPSGTLFEPQIGMRFEAKTALIALFATPVALLACFAIFA